MSLNANRMWIAGAICALCILGAEHVGRTATAAPQPLPAVPTEATLIRLYTGSDGQSHAERVNPKMARNPRFGRDESERVKVASAYVARFPPGYVQDWHPASAHRYVITLSGQGEIELAGGERIPLPPGAILQAEDVTGKGHITRTVGNEPWVTFFVEFDR